MPEPDRQPSPDRTLPSGPAAHGLRPVPKAPRGLSHSPWPASREWPERERTDKRRPWGLASEFADTATEFADTTAEPTGESEPEPAPLTLADTPIFGDLQARWLARDPMPPSDD